MSRKTNDEAQYLHVSKDPSWINSKDTEKHGTESLANIMLFYVVFCPCKQYATQKRTLEYYKWKRKPWTSNRYLKAELNQVATKSFQNQRKMTEWYNVKNELDGLSRADEHWFGSRSEFAVYSNVETSDYMSLFYHIRCALAHGRFLIMDHSGHKFYAFENGIIKGKRFFVKARIVLKEETLLGWIRIITNGPQKNEIVDSFAVIEAMNNNPSVTEQQLIKLLQISEMDLREIINELKFSVDLVYERSSFGKPGIWKFNMQKYEHLLSA